MKTLTELSGITIRKAAAAIAAAKRSLPREEPATTVEIAAPPAPAEQATVEGEAVVAVEAAPAAEASPPRRRPPGRPGRPRRPRARP